MNLLQKLFGSSKETQRDISITSKAQPGTGAIHSKELPVDQELEKLCANQDLGKTIMSLIEATGKRDELQHIVEQHPELLHPEVDAYIQILTNKLQGHGPKQLMEECRMLLAHCRDVGIEKAFAEKKILQDVSEYQTFIIGVNIEEFYCIFGEQLQTRMGGRLPDVVYEAFERKTRWIRQTLVALNVSDDILTTLMRLEANVRQGSSSNQGQTNAVTESIIHSMKVSADIDKLMNQVRQQLSDIQGVQYDSGVFTARIGFCAKMVLGSHLVSSQVAAQMKSEYLKELAWAGNRLGDILKTANKNQTLSAAFEPAYREQLLTLATALAGRTSLSNEKVRDINKEVEKLLAPLGFTPVL